MGKALGAVLAAVTATDLPVQLRGLRSRSAWLLVIGVCRSYMNLKMGRRCLAKAVARLNDLRW